MKCNGSQLGDNLGIAGNTDMFLLQMGEGGATGR